MSNLLSLTDVSGYVTLLNTVLSTFLNRFSVISSIIISLYLWQASSTESTCVARTMFRDGTSQWGNDRNSKGEERIMEERYKQPPPAIFFTELERPQ